MCRAALCRRQAESLIAMGAKPDAKDKKSVSALHFAAAGGHLSICK
jgi:ankyrin repeat protein